MLQIFKSCRFLDEVFMISSLVLVDSTTSNTQNPDETGQDDATLVIAATLSSAGLVVLLVTIFLFKRYKGRVFIYFLRNSIQEKEL